MNSTNANGSQSTRTPRPQRRRSVRHAAKSPSRIQKTSASRDVGSPRKATASPSATKYATGPIQARFALGRQRWRARAARDGATREVSMRRNSRRWSGGLGPQALEPFLLRGRPFGRGKRLQPLIRESAPRSRPRGRTCRWRAAPRRARRPRAPPAAGNAARRRARPERAGSPVAEVLIQVAELAGILRCEAAQAT